MHQKMTTQSQVGRRIFKVTMTDGQKSYLMERSQEEDEWWERLADITEISPAWLRETMGGLPVGVFRRSDFSEAIRKKALCVSDDVICIICPVPQNDSGVLTQITEFA
jgi:hypothetical protein